MSQIIINGQPLYQVDLPEMTLAEWLALPVAERPKEWIRTDADYTDIPAENVSYGSGSVKDALDGFIMENKTIVIGGVSSGSAGWVSEDVSKQGYVPLFAIAAPSSIAVAGGKILTNVELSGSTAYVSYRAFDNISSGYSNLKLTILYKIDAS